MQICHDVVDLHGSSALARGSRFSFACTSDGWRSMVRALCGHWPSHVKDRTLTLEGRLQGLFDGLADMLGKEQEAQSADEAKHRAALRVFFAGLAPAIEVAVNAQRVLDRVAATKFSVFHYFKENENLVSGIFADLLRPDGRHGQGVAFLRLFLDEIDRGGKASIRARRDYGSLEQCSVYTEYATSSGRRIDILLKLGDKMIGIENKPWAHEQPKQLQDYLEFLQGRDDQACVLYLSGSGERSATIEHDHRYLTIPYGHRQSHPSVAHWIAECSRRCHADKVQWFLKDLHEYIGRMFYTEVVEPI